MRKLVAGKMFQAAGKKTSPQSDWFSSAIRTPAAFFFRFFDHDGTCAGMQCGVCCDFTRTQGGCPCTSLWPCPHDAVCNEGKSYGKTVRVDRMIDLRRFPPIPRATKKFERLYDGRTSVERVNARLKIFWGVDDGNIVGARRFHAMVGAVLAVHVAFATLLAAAPRREGTLGKLRLGPIQKALAQQPAA